MFTWCENIKSVIILSLGISLILRMQLYHLDKFSVLYPIIKKGYNTEVIDRGLPFQVN